MKIKQLEIKNFLACPHAIYNFTTGLTVFSAVNEFGKSTMLKAIFYAFNGFDKDIKKNHQEIEILLTFDDGYKLKRSTFNDGGYQFYKGEKLLEKNKGRFCIDKIAAEIYSNRLFYLNHQEQEGALEQSLDSNWSEMLSALLLPPALKKIKVIKADLEVEIKGLYTKHKYSKSKIATVEKQLKSKYQELAECRERISYQQNKSFELEQLEDSIKNKEAQYSLLLNNAEMKSKTHSRQKLTELEAKTQEYKHKIAEVEAAKKEVETEIIRNRYHTISRSKKIVLIALLIATLVSSQIAIKYLFYSFSLLTAIYYLFTHWQSKKESQLKAEKLKNDFSEIGQELTALENCLEQVERQRVEFLYNRSAKHYSDQDEITIKALEAELLRDKNKLYLLTEELNSLPDVQDLSIERAIYKLEEERHLLRFEHDKLLFMLEVLEVISQGHLASQDAEFVQRSNQLLAGLNGPMAGDLKLASGGKILLSRGEENLTLNKLSTAMKNIINLVLKIALLEHFDKEGKLPLLIDDALLSLDLERRNLFLEKLYNLSKERQIIYVTKEKYTDFINLDFFANNNDKSLQLLYNNQQVEKYIL